MTDPVTERTARADFQATSDPALLESADRGEVHLLSYADLYRLWERQQWRTPDIDFSQDRVDWHVRFFARFYSEVGVLESDNPRDRLEETSQHLNPKFHTLVDEMLRGRVDRL